MPVNTRRDEFYARPPGAPHGPFKSEGGRLMLEIHYFDPV
jgi:hypothetical protein